MEHVPIVPRNHMVCLEQWRDKDGDCSTCNNNHNNTSYSKQVAFVIEIVWQLDLYLPMQSVPIAIKFVSSNPTQAMCTQQHYVIKFVSDLWQVGGFLYTTLCDKVCQ